MWRRVLSQSPTEVPNDVAGQQRTREYLDGWKALGALLHGGGSLSGHERNVCFLNTRTGRFADASSAVGFDHDADSRALAALDWDGDGDLDIWTANRTSPRARYLQNNFEGNNHFVQFRLHGTKSNRDAIGARVEVLLDGPGEIPLIKSVVAGEGLVSQTSKWLHFGIGRHEQPADVRVVWPGGAVESFGQVEVDRPYFLVEGSGHATLAERPSSPPLGDKQELVTGTRDPRIVLSRRIPIPVIEYGNLEGDRHTIGPEFSRPTLMNVWASWCEPCIQELADWKKHETQLLSGLRVVALNVDGLDNPQEAGGAGASSASDIWRRMGNAFEFGTIDARNFELLEVIERSLLMQQSPLPIPSSFLLDETGRLAVVYKGPVSAEQIMKDVGQLRQVPDDVRNPSTPFSGTWFSSPFPPDLMAIPSQLVGLRRGIDAYEYITRHVDQPNKGVAWDEMGVTETKLLNVLHNTADLLAREGKTEEAAAIYRVAIRYAPRSWDSHVLLSRLLIQGQAHREALAINRDMAKLRPYHPMPRNNIVWILATSSDHRIRNPQKAVALARQLCADTNHSEPSTLDALAVAYAANGNLREAIQAGEQALAAAQSLNEPRLVEQIKRRIDLLRAEMQESAESRPSR